MIIATIWKCYFNSCCSRILLHILTLLLRIVFNKPCCCRVRYSHLCYKCIAAICIVLLCMGKLTYLKYLHMHLFPHQLSSKKEVRWYLFILISDIYILFIFFLLLFLLLLFLLFLLSTNQHHGGESHSQSMWKRSWGKWKSYLFLPLLQLHFLAAAFSEKSSTIFIYILFSLPSIDNLIDWCSPMLT